MFVMDLPPDVPPQYAPVVIAKASLPQKADKQVDRTIGVCQLIENPTPMVYGDTPSAVNAMSPVRAVNIYFDWFEKQEIGFWITAS